jgi:hypothetical protein
MNLDCPHGSEGLTTACEPCLSETRRTNYRLGQAIGLAAAASIVSSWAASHAIGSEIAEVLGKLVDQLKAASEDKSFSLRAPAKVSPNMAAVRE